MIPLFWMGSGRPSDTLPWEWLCTSLQEQDWEYCNKIIIVDWIKCSNRCQFSCLSKLVPDCDVPALGVWLHGAGLLRDLHGVLHGFLKALGLPLHHLTLVFGANLSLDLSFNIQITLDTLSFFTCPHWVTGKPLSRASTPTKGQTI